MASAKTPSTKSSSRPKLPAQPLSSLPSKTVNLFGLGRSKFNVASDPTERTVHGIVFDSRAEATFYRFLHAQLSPEFFRRQLQFELAPLQKYADPLDPGKAHTLRPVRFSPDFLIGGPFPDSDEIITDFRFRPWQIVIDVKGMIMNDYVVRAKWFARRYGVPVIPLKNVSLKNMARLLPALQRSKFHTQMKVW